MFVRKVFAIVLAALAAVCPSLLHAQQMSKEELIYLTSEWKGERFPDGRPKVPDDLIRRARNIGTEEAWTILNNEGYHCQFEGGWKSITDSPMVGRALTASFIPSRPDLEKAVKDKGKKEGRIGNTNSWPIDMLTNGDVYVADGFGKITGGTLIGDNLGNSIYAHSHNGVVFDASARDLEGLSEIGGFNAFVRDWDPSYLKDEMLIGLNTPIRIGHAVVMPGDLVLARKEGVIFIPAHLAEKVINTAEFIQRRDKFGITRLKEGRYTPGQIDNDWTDAIRTDFLQWLQQTEKVTMTREQLDSFLQKRTW